MTRTPSSPDYRPRLTPPPSLSKGPATIWQSTVDAVASDHFSPSDTPLLAEFCRAAHQADQAAAALIKGGTVVDGKPSPWLSVQEKAQKAMVALSARLRLCPQSRFDRLKAGTSSRRGDPSATPKPLGGLAEFL
jgi:phage terminase small subunit